MSFANFGIGIGAFAQGLQGGMQIGKQIKSEIQQGKIDAAKEEGMKAAKEARNTAIDNLVQTGGAPNASNTMTVPTYQVGDQSYADQASARKAAESQVGDISEFYNKVAAPKIYEQMLEIDPEKAAAWKEFTDTQGFKTGLKHWSTAVAKSRLGDFEGAGHALMKAYNSRGYLDDGTEATAFTPTKDDKGNTIGATITFKGADGKEYQQSFNGTDDLLKVGVGMLAPEKVFDFYNQERTTRLKAEAEVGKENRKFQRDVALSDRKAEQAKELQTQRDNAATDRVVTGKQMDAAAKSDQYTKKVEALRSAGYTPEWINQNMPAIMGIGEYKKAAAPEEVRRMLHQARLGDYTYARKPPAEQQKILDADMQLIGVGQRQQQNPMAGGIAPTGGATVIDTTTGRIVPKP